jgi:hypothetical protein
VLIGGTDSGAANRIAFNGGDGISLRGLDDSGTSISILGNSIYANDGLGIDAAEDGVTLNDPGDGDSGPNDLQNYPVLANADTVGTTTTVDGTLNSEPDETYRLEFFANTTADPSGYGEGETLLGATDVTTDAEGNAAFTVSFDTPFLVPLVTATATDAAGNTSEFSQAVSVGPPVPPPPEEESCLQGRLLSLCGPQQLDRGANINVSNDSAAQQSEMSLDINPTNPLNVTGFSHRIGSLNEIDVFVSYDGGDTWSTTQIDDGSTGISDGLGPGLRFDPSIAFDDDGNLYVAYGHDDGDRTQLVVARSFDGGTTFAQFSIVDAQANLPKKDGGTLPGLDKWHLATGLDPSTGNQAVYVAYTENATEGILHKLDQRIKVAGSNDGGLTFPERRIVNDGSLDGAQNFNLFADPAVGPNGELYVSWHELEGSGSGDKPDIWFDRDLDGMFCRC